MTRSSALRATGIAVTTAPPSRPFGRQRPHQAFELCPLADRLRDVIEDLGRTAAPRALERRDQTDILELLAAHTSFRTAQSRIQAEHLAALTTAG
jgi:hypothetical protein